MSMHSETLPHPHCAFSRARGCANLQELFTAEPASTQQSKAFLKAYSSYLVPVLILGQQQDELAAVASAMGKIW